MGVLGRPSGQDIPKSSGIYALLCPYTGEVRYIGKSKNMHKRLISHRHSKKNLPVSNWIQKLRNSGIDPIMSVIHICSEKELDDLEVKEIQNHRNNGHALLNLHGGGMIPASMGNGKSKAVWSIDGYRTPYMLFTQHFFCMRNNKKIKKILKEISEYNKSLKTEPEKLNFQLWCAQVMQKHLVGEELTKFEQYLIILANQVNQKYQDRLTIVYNDGVEDTPRGSYNG